MAKNTNPVNESISIDRLYFFNDNPRHEHIDNEPGIIAALYTKEKVFKLAQHISEYGVNPLERVAVIRHPNVTDSYTVVEGNRRLCALKLLRDPLKAPSAASRQALEKLKNNGLSLPLRIEATIFSNYADARIWMNVKHRGEQQGVGIVSWLPGQQARFDSQEVSTVSKNPNTQALLLLDYAEDAKLITSAQKAKISLTTISRYLSSPIVRDTFGLVNNFDLLLKVEQSEFDIVVSKFLIDALPKSPSETPVVNSRTISSERANYARDLRNEGLTPVTVLEVPINPLPTKKHLANNSLKNTAGRNTQHPDDRKFIISTDFKFKSKDKTLRRIFEELRTIDPEKFGFAAGYLLRAFVEQTAHLYAGHHNLGTDGELHNVIARCAEKLKTNGAKDKATSMLRIMSSEKNSRLSVHTMGQSVHCSIIPKAVELKRQWDSLETGFGLMLADIK